MFNIWIGISDLEDEGVWNTIYGETIWIGVADGYAVNDFYTNWQPNEPNNIDGADCAILHKGTTTIGWDDTPCNIDYNKLSSIEMDQFRGKRIGMIFQKPYFVRNLNILDNLLLSLYLSENRQDKKRAIQLLKDIGLGNKLESIPDELSQGEQQRAAIALAVIKNPELILADEPTSSLDDANCEKIIALLKEQAKKTKAQLIIITHDNRIKKEFNKSISL